MSNDVLAAVLAIIILCGVILVMYLRKKNNPSEKDKMDAAKFIDGLSTVFYDTILFNINNADISKYDSILDAEVDILGQVYDQVWNYVEKELEKAAQEDIVSAMALKIIDKDYVTGFAQALVEKYRMCSKLEQRWAVDFATRAKKIEEAEEEAKQKFLDESQYNIEEIGREDLEPAIVVEPTEEELAKLNPPSDDEEELSEDDETIEVIDE